MIKKYSVFCISFLLQSQNFMQAVPLNSHKQLLRAILYRVVQTKKEGFPSFETLKNQPYRDRNFEFTTLHNDFLKSIHDELRMDKFYLDGNFFHANKVSKENHYPYQLSDKTIQALQHHIPNFPFGNPEFDEECKYACMYCILGQARKMQETFQSDHPQIAFELLAMYPLKELYRPYIKISKIIATHERPWVSFWSAKYSFLNNQE
ncbi:hypothetical protein [Candidatus Chromulinivorax destructor]|uniref:Uncharacterized protein n=1 Tax=Candidatus Chromulinivorax destructor TaxID=2066483 RepID=A0A345ZAG5_9BACT|nr:hypothetical protein [Candidatus Chromulinivorax destructor]AXK60282.1 hypothetical protein C0J27_00755 [Candidatus Chromulinivorax destructor]